MDSSRPLPKPGLKSGLKPGVGRWGSPLRGQTLGLPFTSCAWGSPPGRANCLLLFDLNRVSLGFLLLWGPFIFSSSLARGRGGCWDAECGVRGAAFAFAESRRPGRVRGAVGCGARCGPGLRTPFGEFAQGWVRELGPRTQGSPGSWASRPPVAPPHAELLPSVPLTDNLGGGGVGSAEDSAAIRGTFTLLSSSSEILLGPREERGEGAHSPLLTRKGSPNSRVVINSTPTKVGGEN